MKETKTLFDSIWYFVFITKQKNLYFCSSSLHIALESSFVETIKELDKFW